MLGNIENLKKNEVSKLQGLIWKVDGCFKHAQIATLLKWVNDASE